ncbi:MAG: WYL domain-containing protein [Roseofilum sp. SBFL]|uniref:helix-turn-helix transcriptional regulator n=1 Tax=unclassified Roseofilum TaxID=2620099 RepID=UPI001B27FC26|nr:MULTISPECIES: WYL domain-containing protein [unclassified Roseofilum]MBP0013789.1 WYL domain-containing protein [Roseofilum sp. SID3]MBP0026241.1 WYL domain-containing protein [Roseofilum sp. SID2]MBP0040585.1 WYL domain-containing protein [Roseofilum sp. SBFL]
MARKKETITLSIPPGTKAKLEAIAARLEILWGSKPSISGLLVAIAEQAPETQKLFTLNSSQVQALRQALNLLDDEGYIGEARTILDLLLKHGNLTPPLRQSFEQLDKQLSQAWRIRVDRYIDRQQPFRLWYENAQNSRLIFTVRHAQVSFHEKRSYLEIWCDETEDLINTEFPELIHNRCLRFNRIQSIEDTPGYWQPEGLQTLEVYLHFYRGMVRAYEPKGDEIQDLTIGEVRQVVRQVSNPFWLLREVRRYGEDCEIIAPQKLRDRYIDELRKQCQRYGMEMPERE